MPIMDNIDLNRTTHLRDVSFSSYLTMVGDNFPVNLPDPPQTRPSPSPLRPRRTKKEGELGVFAAERYYTATADEDERDDESNHSSSIADNYARRLGYSKERITTPNRRLNRPNLLGTPSVSSEASSSWNSQGALLTRKKANTRRGSAFLLGSCNGGRSCSDKNSVAVRKPVRKSEALQIDPKLVVFDGTKQSLPRFRSNPRKEELEEARVSLEVFGGKRGGGLDENDDVSRKLSMLTWDAIPTKTKTKTKSQEEEEEIESDASSDLFEIENISSRKMMTSTAASGYGYEPSEASIEWSVVTASAADLSEKRVSENSGTAGRSGILGCKSHKAVRVVEPTPISSYRSSTTTSTAAAANRNHHHRSNQRSSNGSGSRSGDFEFQ